MLPQGSYSLPCTTSLLMPKTSQCLCIRISADVGNVWYAVLDGKELHLTPDVLAGIYQCNISHLDDPQIQTSNPGIRQAL